MRETQEQILRPSVIRRKLIVVEFIKIPKKNYPRILSSVLTEVRDERALVQHVIENFSDKFGCSWYNDSKNLIVRLKYFV